MPGEGAALRGLSCVKRLWGAFVLALLWTLLFAAARLFGLSETLSGKGFSVIGNEFWRIGTAPLLHAGLLHLSVNLVTLYFAADFLEKQIGQPALLFFSLGAGTLSSLLFAAVFPRSVGYLGGSFATFALMGLILAFQLCKKDVPRFRLGTWYGNWLAVTAIVGNFPILPFMGWDTPVLHAISFLIGLGAGALACLFQQKQR